jgi:hypothetical protein
LALRDPLLTGGFDAAQLAPLGKRVTVAFDPDRFVG